MKKFIFLQFFVISLSSCAQYHSVISSRPCFYPYKKYSFELCMDYYVLIDEKIYKIPSKFISDFASIPRPLWIFSAPHEAEVIPASEVHDYMYTIHANVTRNFADDVFYNMLIKDGVSVPRAWLFWISVRMFGGFSYHRR